MSKISCKHCQKKFGKHQIFNHYEICPEYEKTFSYYDGLFMTIWSNGICGDPYVIHCAINHQTTFKQLDKFLRDTWCECHSNHQSKFTHLLNEETNETKPINKNLVMNLTHDKIIYQYDMGDTTTIYMSVDKKLTGEIKIDEIKLLFQNDPPKIKCGGCKKLNSTIYCDYEPYCDDCKDKLKNEDCDFLPIVNSPRTGVCGYS